MDDKQIIDLYFDRSQHAAEAAREKYGAHCCAIAYNILESEEEAETCADGVWPLAWEAMPPHRPSRLSSFLGGITRRLALDRWSKHSLKQRSEGNVAMLLLELEECMPADLPEDMLNEECLAAAAAAYLRTKPLLHRMAFIRRYWYCNTVKVIARQLSLPERRVEALLRLMREELRETIRREAAAQ